MYLCFCVFADWCTKVFNNDGGLASDQAFVTLSGCKHTFVSYIQLGFLCECMYGMMRSVAVCVGYEWRKNGGGGGRVTK
jgi:hypothetical protein